MTNKELISELVSRNLLTSAVFHDSLVKHIMDDGEFKVILTFGTPNGVDQCSRCRATKPTKQFNYYSARVSADGYLQRSNAVCKDCTKEHGSELKEAKKKCNNLPKKPKAGDICLHCHREWNGNWHLHHREDKIIGYICGHCNMSFSDHRNKEVNKKRNTNFDDIF